MAMLGHAVVVALGLEILSELRAQWILLTISCQFRSVGLMTAQKVVLYKEADWHGSSEFSPLKLDYFLLHCMLDVREIF